jgi:hypothetical protein
MKAANKKTLYIAEDDLEWFNKAKELFPSISISKILAETLKDRVQKYEAQQAGMIDHDAYKGTNDTKSNVYTGRTFKFKGVKIAAGNKSDAFSTTTFDVYLTLKGKFLVTYCKLDHFHEEDLNYMVFETFDELTANGKLTSDALKICTEYLIKNSDLRHYEILDV